MKINKVTIVIVVLIAAVAVGIGASFIMNPENLKADVLSGNSTVKGSLQVYRDLYVRGGGLVYGDLGVAKNKWGSIVIKDNGSNGFVECPEGQYVIGYNQSTNEIKCAGL
ncbi:hypothetical protein GF340_05105 [Candidatus Peregrinibacteria bacterium]|nr:hypothetical protein [Candidatus Peregrinibacteria bacterium]